MTYGRTVYLWLTIQGTGHHGSSGSRNLDSCLHCFHSQKQTQAAVHIPPLCLYSRSPAHEMVPPLINMDLRTSVHETKIIHPPSKPNSPSPRWLWLLSSLWLTLTFNTAGTRMCLLCFCSSFFSLASCSFKFPFWFYIRDKSEEVQVGLERLTLLCQPGVGITGVCHHTLLVNYYPESIFISSGLGNTAPPHQSFSLSHCS